MFIVMSAITMTAKNSNRKRCFETNAVGFATRAEAQVEADRRNAIERKAGHTNVEWYPSSWVEPAELLRRRRAGEPLIQGDE